MNYPCYSVAIRTLGKAGEKYLETLRSCERQIVKPEKILVYIPYGYDLPNESIGIEEYVRGEKGMVAQRSLPFDEIESDFILFLDDDVSFKSDFIKILFDELLENQGDCISPLIFPNHKENFWGKINQGLYGTFPHWKREWAFVVRKDSHYSYNISPEKSVLRTQTSAGPCALCRKSAYLSIHFEDERWLDRCSYSFGEDQLFFYKLHVNGYKLLISYDTYFVHLDAGSSRSKNEADLSLLDFYTSYFRYVIWKRSIFELQQGGVSKLNCILSFYFTLTVSLLTYGLLPVIKHGSLQRYRSMLGGIREARKYLRTKEYSILPSFLIKAGTGI